MVRFLNYINVDEECAKQTATTRVRNVLKIKSEVMSLTCSELVFEECIYLA